MTSRLFSHAEQVNRQRADFCDLFIYGNRKGQLSDITLNGSGMAVNTKQQNDKKKRLKSESERTRGLAIYILQAYNVYHRI